MKPLLSGFGYIVAIALPLAFSSAAEAYVGPGAGLGVIGTLMAFVGTVLFAIVGFIWYPIKRLLRKRKPATAEAAPAAASDAVEHSESKPESVS